MDNLNIWETLESKTNTTIDPKTLHLYIHTHIPCVQKMIYKIIQNTHYYTTKELVQLVREAFQSFLNKNIDYNLFVPPFRSKIGSEHFLLLQLEDLILKKLPKSIITLYNQKIENNYPIVVIDDAIYSSCNMCSHIDNYTYETKDFRHKWYCIVGITSSIKPQVCDFNAEIITTVNLEDYRFDKLFTTKIEQEDARKAFGCETNDVLPCYLEYKISNAFGSYQFYYDIIRDPVSRNCIDCITESDMNDFIKRITSKESEKEEI